MSLVVGVEEDRGADPGRGGDGPAGESLGELAVLLGPSGPEGDTEVPPGDACSGGEQECLLELRDRNRLLARLEGEGAGGDLHPEAEPPGSSSEEGMHEGELLQLVDSGWVRRHGVPCARGGRMGCPSKVMAAEHEGKRAGPPQNLHSRERKLPRMLALVGSCSVRVGSGASQRGVHAVSHCTPHGVVYSTMTPGRASPVLN